MALHIFRKKSSSELAKDRLKVLLISDRINCSPEMMDMIRADISKVISKYMKIDAESVEVQITKELTRGRRKSPTLYANIPILELKH